MELRSVLAAALLAVALAPLAPRAVVAQGPPADREIRTTKDTITGDTLTTLTLMLAGPRGPLPVNLSITIIRKARPEGGPRVAHRLDIDMPMYTGPLDHTAPQVSFDLGGSQVLSLSVDSRAMPPAVTHITATPFSADDLARMGKAATIRGRLFGIEFVLTPAQVTAVRDFARR